MKLEQLWQTAALSPKHRMLRIAPMSALRSPALPATPALSFGLTFDVGLPPQGHFSEQGA